MNRFYDPKPLLFLTSVFQNPVLTDLIKNKKYLLQKCEMAPTIYTYDLISVYF